MAGKVSPPFTDEEILAELKKLGHYDVSPEIFQLMKNDLSNLMAKDRRYISSGINKNSYVKDSVTINARTKADNKQSSPRSPIHQQFKKSVKISEEESPDSFSRSPTSSPSVDVRISKYKNSFAAYKLKKNAVYPSDTIHETENDVNSYGNSPIRKYRSTLSQYRAENILNSPVNSVTDCRVKKTSSNVTNSIQNHLIPHEINSDMVTNANVLATENGSRNDSQNNSPTHTCTSLRHFEKEKEQAEFRNDDNPKTSVSLNKYKDSLNNYKMRRYTVRSSNEKGNVSPASSSVDKQNNSLNGQKIESIKELQTNVTVSKNIQGNKLFQNSGKMKTFIKSSDSIDHVDVTMIPIIDDSNDRYKNDSQSTILNDKSKGINTGSSTLLRDEVGRNSRSASPRYNEVHCNSSAKKHNMKTDKAPKREITKVKVVTESTSDSKPNVSLHNSDEDAKHSSDEKTNDDDEIYNSPRNLESIQMYKDSVNLFKLKKKYAKATDLVKRTECNLASPTAKPVNNYRNALCSFKLRSYVQGSPRYADGIGNLADFGQTSTLSSGSKSSKTIKRKILRHVNGVAVVTEEMLQIPIILDTSYPESDSLPSNKSFSSDDLSFQSNGSTGSVTATSPKAISNSQSTLSLTSLPLMPSRIPVQRKKKNDPVAMYGYYQKYWKNYKPPGEKTHDKLRWAVRDKMLEYHL